MAFECFIVLNILGVGVTTGLGLELEKGDTSGVAATIDVVTVVTFYVFILEAVLKIVAYGPNPHHYFLAPDGEGSFNSFDFLLVVLSVALLGQNSAGAIKTLRLARLVRLLTIIKNVPELKVIVEGLVAGLKSVGYIVLLLLLVIYLFAVLGVMNFGANDPANFGKVPVAMVTLFQGATLTGWAAASYTQIYGCDNYVEGFYTVLADGEKPAMVDTMTGPMYSWECSDPSKQPLFSFLFFTVFTIITAMVIMSLFIGVITMVSDKGKTPLCISDRGPQTQRYLFLLLSTQGMFDSYQNMKTTLAAREYHESLADAQSDLLAPGSVTAMAIDAAMADRPRRAVVAVHSNKWLEAFRQVAATCTTIEDSPKFQSLITGCIIVAGVVIGLSTDEIGSAAALRFVDLLCLVLFTVEMVIKVLAFEFRPWEYFKDSWNRFDCIIVLNGWLEVAGLSFEGLTILRLLRLLRVFRLVKALPRLRSIVESLIQGFASVVWIMVLMGIFNYIMACLGMLLFKATDPFHYSTVLSALFTTYMCETLDRWETIIRVNMIGCANFPGGYPFAKSTNEFECDSTTEGLGLFAALYYIFVVVFGGLILPTMLIGIVAISFEEAFRKSEAERESIVESAKMIELARADMPKYFTAVRIELLK